MSTVTEESYLIGSNDDPKVRVFLDRAHKARTSDATVSAWHMNIYAGTEGVVSLPYGHDERWTNVTVIDSIRDEETGAYTYPVNEAKTLAILSAIAKFASKQKGVTVEKKYDSTDFELHITIPVPGGGDDDAVTVKYYASRELVCTKKVVGTKVIPARVVDEKVEEIVEWDCKPVSLLGFAVDDAEV